MIRQGFRVDEREYYPFADSIVGKLVYWWVMAYYDIKEKDMPEIYITLKASGDRQPSAKQAVEVLSKYNTGYTFSNFNIRSTTVCMSKATSFDEAFSTITHEIKHITENISEYYGIDPKSERAAYLQGEIGKQMYDAIAMVVCPCCGSNHFKRRKCY